MPDDTNTTEQSGSISAEADADTELFYELLAEQRY